MRDEKLDIHGGKLDIAALVAKSSAKVAIDGSSHSPTIKKVLSLIADSFVGHAFGRREIMIATGARP